MAEEHGCEEHERLIAQQQTLITTLTQRNGGDEMKIGFGGKSISFRGFTVTVIVCLAVQAGLTFYSVDRFVRQMSREHTSIVEPLDRATCINSLNFDQRDVLRRSLASGTVSQAMVFRAWCPWMAGKGFTGDGVER